MIFTYTVAGAAGAIIALYCGGGLWQIISSVVISQMTVIVYASTRRS